MTNEIPDKRLCPLSVPHICDRSQCALWEEFTEHCGLITQAWLAGREALNQEARERQGLEGQPY